MLNRYHERTAAPGAPSRGVLPLLGVVHGAAWVDHVALTGMAGFLLVLITPDRLTSWEFDGEQLTATEHPDGTHVFTSGGSEGRGRTGSALSLPAASASSRRASSPAASGSGARSPTTESVACVRRCSSRRIDDASTSDDDLVRGFRCGGRQSSLGSCLTPEGSRRCR